MTIKDIPQLAVRQPVPGGYFSKQTLCSQRSLGQLLCFTPSHTALAGGPQWERGSASPLPPPWACPAPHTLVHFLLSNVFSRSPASTYDFFFWLQNPHWTLYSIFFEDVLVLLFRARGVLFQSTQHTSHQAPCSNPAAGKTRLSGLLLTSYQ